MADHMHDGHRQRMKNRFRIGGLTSFEQHEIIEMLLFFGVSRKDTNPLAHRLVRTFGSLGGVLDAPYEELLRVDGVTEHIATLLNFSGALAREYYRRQAGTGLVLTDTDETGRYILPHFMGADREMVFLICMDARNRVLNSNIIHRGDINVTEISARLILQTALRHNATAVILAHNHPQGLAIPSKQDVLTTIALRKTLDAAGVFLLDHLVVANNDYVSMRDTESLAHIFSMNAAQLAAIKQ